MFFIRFIPVTAALLVAACSSSTSVSVDTPTTTTTTTTDTTVTVEVPAPGGPHASGEFAESAEDTLIGNTDTTYQVRQYTGEYFGDGDEAAAGDVATTTGNDSFPVLLDTEDDGNASLLLQNSQEELVIGQIESHSVFAVSSTESGNPVRARGIAMAEYSVFGTWMREHTDDGDSITDFEFGAFTTGEETPSSGVPTTGTATYDGDFLGYTSLDTDLTPTLYHVHGDSSVTVNFATDTLSGSLTNIVVDNGNNSGTSMNDFTMTGTMTNTSFSGTITAGATTGNVYDITAGTDGDLSGWFYGDGAEEIGGTVSIEDSDNVLVGSFGGDQ